MSDARSSIDKSPDHSVNEVISDRDHTHSAQPPNTNESSGIWFKGRIPSLDGLRAVSLLLVTIEHLSNAKGSPVTGTAYKYLSLGSTGVDVFFVISGFLITHLLLRESVATGRISLRDFYLKRALRIAPAFYVFLAILWILRTIGLLSIKPFSLLLCATYTLNMTTRFHTDANGHVWSLCVEEHFYLLWPAVLAFCGRKLAIWLVFLLLFVGFVARFVIWYTIHDAIDIDRFTLTRFDAIAGGCILALFTNSSPGKRAARFVQGRGDGITVVATILLLLSVFIFSKSGKYELGPKRPIEAGLIVVVVFTLAADTTSFIAWLLNTWPFVAVGVLSYSLYLAQTFATAGSSPGWPLSWWWNLPLTIAYALFSYWLIERPALRLKDRLFGQRAIG